MTVTVPGNVRLARHVGDLDDDGHDIFGSGGGTTIVITEAAMSGGTQTITASLADVAGCTLSATPSTTEVWLVEGWIDSRIASNDANPTRLYCDFDGGNPADTAQHSSGGASRIGLYMSWQITGVTAAAHTVKLQVLKDGGAVVHEVLNEGGTKIRLTRLV